MKNIFLLAFVWLASLGVSAQTTGTYRNPIIPGYHPDPSVCRVGDKFYLVNSSFQYFPGVPLFESTDLIHWQQTGNVLTRASQVPLKGASSWLGIYAPTLRYHDGTYYMITTNVGNGGNFMVTAQDPRGPWSEPIWLKQQGIDPSLYFEGGKCYMVSNPNDAIWLCEIDPKTGKQLTESRKIWEGDGGRYPEGPHIYKKDGYYYLLISEGGTELAHRLTIARSRKIEGPYESNPHNPLLTNCSRAGQTKQIQGTGHGDFVQAKDGSWWLVFLAYRNFGGSYHHLGRETFLAPVEWKKGQWPVVNGGQPADTLMTAQLLPASSELKEAEENTFSPGTEAPEWLYIQNPIADRYLQSDGVTLLPHGTLTENNNPTFLGRRQESAAFSLETEVALTEQEGGTIADDLAAGLTVYQINDGHLDLVVTNRSIELRCRLKSIGYTVKSIPLDKFTRTQIGGNRLNPRKIKLLIESDGTMYRFYSAQNGQHWQEMGEMNCSLMSTEVAGGFTGVILGMTAEGSAQAGKAQFTTFKYKPKK